MELLYLSEEDMISAGVKDMRRCINTMEDTFKLLNRGDFRLGGTNNSAHGLRTRFPEKSDIENMPLDAPGRWFTAMPAYLGGKYHCFGIKTYGANQENYQNNLPRSILMMQLLDVETGAPFAFMSANILSAMRTGGVSGLFARYFAPRLPRKVAIIGPGVIGRYSLDAVMSEYPRIEKISIFGRGEKSRKAFCDYCREKGYPSNDDMDCLSIEEACDNADIIITASTQAERFGDYPLIGKNCIKEGACIIVTSAIRMERAYLNDKNNRYILVADDVRAYAESRGIDALPRTEEEKKTVTVKGAITERLLTHGDILNLPQIVDDPGFARDPNTTYICASGGIPIEDVSWAYECYETARNNKIGLMLPVWKSSHL